MCKFIRCHSIELFVNINFADLERNATMLNDSSLLLGFYEENSFCGFSVKNNSVCL